MRAHIAITLLCDALRALEAKAAELAKERDARAQIAQAHKEAQEKLQQLGDTFQAESAELAAERTRRSETVKALEAARAQASRDAASRAKELDGLKSILESTQAKVASLSADKEYASKRLYEVELRLSIANQEREQVEVEKKSVSDQLWGLKTRVHTSADAIRRAVSEIELLAQRAARSGVSYNPREKAQPEGTLDVGAIVAGLSQLVLRVNSAKETIARILTDKENQTSTVRAMQSQLSQALRSKEKAERDCSTATEQIRNLEQRLLVARRLSSKGT
ncbi:hypothetical protein WOLCODRAFT_149989 [Wolfiporia cocos MD-104 SS10]|uniref:Uncharacterized protein n=1 Tax=Wolfiporia cocos (strain MD-104) TaxID=742152 RepID=A0A2H3JQC0_WOLCO|nr:hypothetical protein WOLCODRAFT_149989 [Wolfiporia cocos MD-104 SS10]